MSIFSKFFDKLFGRREREERIKERLETQAQYESLENIEDDDDFVHSVSLKDSQSIKNYLVKLCEQIIDISKEMGDVRQEYKKVTLLLKDVQIVDELEGEQKKILQDVATNVSNLTKVRNECLNAERKLSDEAFRQIEEVEDEMPAIIRRYMDNEKYLDTIRRDLNRLAGEKIEWSVLRHERQEEQEQLKRISMILLAVFGTIAVLVGALSIMLEWELLPLFIVALLATIAAVYIIVRMQDCARDIKKCNINQNYAIALENRVKIKYVNIRNAVDYTSHRFNVVNSKELTTNYEKYIEICKEREKYKQTNEELEYYHGRMLMMLRKLELHDPRSWIVNADAIINPKEMVEVKHALFSRRQKIREQIDYNLNEIGKIRQEIEGYSEFMGNSASQINAILKKVEDLNKGL